MPGLVIVSSSGHDRNIGLGFRVGTQVDRKLHPYPDPQPSGLSQDLGDMVGVVTVRRTPRTENHDLALDQPGTLAMKQAKLSQSIVFLATPASGPGFKIGLWARCRSQDGAHRHRFAPGPPVEASRSSSQACHVLILL